MVMVPCQVSKADSISHTTPMPPATAWLQHKGCARPCMQQQEGAAAAGAVPARRLPHQLQHQLQDQHQLWLGCYTLLSQGWISQQASLVCLALHGGFLRRVGAIAQAATAEMRQLRTASVTAKIRQLRTASATAETCQLQATTQQV